MIKLDSIGLAPAIDLGHWLGYPNCIRPVSEALPSSRVVPSKTNRQPTWKESLCFLKSVAAGRRRSAVVVYIAFLLSHPFSYVACFHPFSSSSGVRPRFLQSCSTERRDGGQGEGESRRPLYAMAVAACRAYGD